MTCKPMRIPPRYCNKGKNTNRKKNDPRKIKLKTKAIKSNSKTKNTETRNLKPCEAHKPIPGEPGVTPTTIGELTSTCNFDVYLLRKRKKIIPKVVISKGNCDFISDLSRSVLPTVKCKLCKPIRPENNVVFSVECSSKSKKQRTKRRKSKSANTAGINIFMDPSEAHAPEKRKGMNKMIV